MKMSSEPAEKRLKMPMKLGYWKIRGYAQPIRLLLAYTNTEFEDVLYEQGDGPDYSGEKWYSVKFTLGFDFPNLPYLVDGDVRMTQSPAIFHYIARKYDLCGKTEADKWAVEMIENVVMDFRDRFDNLNYGKDPEEVTSRKDNYVAMAKETLKRLSDYLGDKPWITGSELTCADFMMYEAMDVHRTFEPTILDDFANIKAFLDRFEGLPAIQDYMKSDQFIRRPINNKVAHWPGN